MDNQGLLLLVGTIFMAVLSFLGVRFTANRSAKASQESVGVTALSAALAAWQAQAARTDAELQGVKTDLKDTKTHYDNELDKLRRLLSVSREYVAILLSAWKMRFPDHEPPSPPAGYNSEE